MWKARKNKIFKANCMEFEDCSNELKGDIIRSFQIDGDPVIVFNDGGANWTLLTTDEVVSKIDGNVYRFELDTLSKDVRVFADKEMPRDDVKRSANFLSVGKDEKRIWFSSSTELFSFLNIIQMFPINVPSSS